MSNVVLGDTGPLPDSFVQVELSTSDDTGWRLTLTFLDGTNASQGFAGGTYPRAWLAQELAGEHGFPLQNAIETSRRLFANLLPEEPTHSSSSEPYGMEHPIDDRAR